MAKLVAFNTDTNKWELVASAPAQFDKEIEITEKGVGLILTSPDGNRWSVSVDNTGTLITTAL